MIRDFNILFWIILANILQQDTKIALDMPLQCLNFRLKHSKLRQEITSHIFANLSPHQYQAMRVTNNKTFLFQPPAPG